MHVRQLTGLHVQAVQPGFGDAVRPPRGSHGRGVPLGPDEAVPLHAAERPVHAAGVALAVVQWAQARDEPVPVVVPFPQEQQQARL